MIIVLLADGFEEIEALTPVDMLRRAGHDVKTVGIQDRTVTGSHGISVIADAIPSEIDLSTVELAVFPGGMPGATNLDASPYTDEVIRAVVKNGGRLAAICAAPLVFGRRGLLHGRTATCFAGFEKELCGAIISKRAVVTDGMFTTANGMTAAYAFSEELVRLCEDDKKGAREELTLIDPIKLSEVEDVTADPDAIKLGSDILDTLANLGVKCKIQLLGCGPRFYQYAITPGKGVKVNNILNLFSDIQLCLGVEGMRMEAPIPGKTAIGLEIPKKKPEVVMLEKLWEEKELIDASNTTVPIGKAVDGTPVFADIKKLPHVIIGGATGMGKSVIAHGMITTLVKRSDPKELKLILIDPKRVEYSWYSKLPHLLCPVITDISKTVSALRWACDEMERRYALLSDAEARNIDAYNEKVKANEFNGSPLPRIIIFIDELSDLMMQARNDTENTILSISQKARAAGIHLVIGTQRPSVDVITGVIKANIPSRISCKVATYNDSRTLLEHAGAEKLLNNGDMLYIPAGAPKAIRVQGAYISDANAEKVALEASEKYGAPEFTEIPDYPISPSRPQDFDDDEEDDILCDEQFLEAVYIAVKQGKVSTSLLQRKLSIGYARAATYIDYMEDLGFISESNGSKPRDVLITMDELNERLEGYK